MAERKSGCVSVFGYLFAVAFLVTVAVLISKGCESLKPTDEERARTTARWAAEEARVDNKHFEAAGFIQQHVENNLKAPRTAKFPWLEEAGYLGDGRYELVSYVDAQNVFGALIRTRYYCIVKYQDSHWSIENFAFLE